MLSKIHDGRASRANGGKHLCGSDLRIKQSVVEWGLLAGIKHQLLSPAAIQETVMTAIRLLHGAGGPGSLG